MDLVPTVSLLLDVPIPFSNIGRLIAPLFATDGTRLRRAMKLNAVQVLRYAQQYRGLEFSLQVCKTFSEKSRRTDVC